MQHLRKLFTSDRLWAGSPEELLPHVGAALSGMTHARSGRPIWNVAPQAHRMAPPEHGHFFEAGSDGGGFKPAGDHIPSVKTWYGRLNLTCCAVVRQDDRGNHGVLLVFDFRDTEFFGNSAPDLVVYCSLRRMALYFARQGKLSRAEYFPWVLNEGEWLDGRYLQPPPYYGMPQPQGRNESDPRMTSLVAWHYQLQSYGCSEFFDG